MSNFNEIENLIVQKLESIQGVILKGAAIEWRKSITKNFEEGGRPPWPPRKKISKKQKGTNILVISGAMKNVSTLPDLASNIVTLKVDPRARAYARIHNEGGTINMPARKLKFRKNKVGKSVFASSKHKKIIKEVTAKAYVIKIPKREYTNVPIEDFNARWVPALKKLINL